MTALLDVELDPELELDDRSARAARRGVVPEDVGVFCDERVGDISCFELVLEREKMG